MDYLFFDNGPPDNTILVFTDPSTCVPCKRYEPIINDVSKTHRIKKYLPSDPLFEEFKCSAIPTTIIYVKKKEISRFVGFQTKEQLLKMKGINDCKKERSI